MEAGKVRRPDKFQIPSSREIPIIKAGQKRAADLFKAIKVLKAEMSHLTSATSN